MKHQDSGRWSPYLAGALSGVVLVLSVWITGKYFGASTTFARTAGAVERLIAPERVKNMAYFAKYAAPVDWQSLFWVGLMAGSFLAALTSSSFTRQMVPDMWSRRFSADPVRRGMAAFFGGLIALFGARMADGCPSGHGLSGLAQMAVSGYVALICFFIGGIIAARLIYGGGRQ